MAPAPPYLRGFVEAGQPSNLRGSLLGAGAAAEHQQRPLADQQHVTHVQVDVLLALFLVVVERAVLKALRRHDGSGRLWLSEARNGGNGGGKKKQKKVPESNYENSFCLRGRV